VYYGEADNFGGASGEGSGADGGGTWPGDPFLGRSDAGAGVPHDQGKTSDSVISSSSLTMVPRRIAGSGVYLRLSL
jgi:hypothetical protein